MKIVLYGGTFDPVHSEHVKLARGALKELSPDKLIVLPSYIPPHKAAAA
ncbi:MAG: nicotinate-nucleotide adenylyltransferase, partial [Clostridia bacterium]|nr:nicotinate-nucleotide adenylyltransferase [Clostridia bacterium]